MEVGKRQKSWESQINDDKRMRSLYSFYDHVFCETSKIFHWNCASCILLTAHTKIRKENDENDTFFQDNGESLRSYDVFGSNKAEVTEPMGTKFNYEFESFVVVRPSKKSRTL